MLTSSPEFIPQFQNGEGKWRYLKVSLPPNRQVLHTMLSAGITPKSGGSSCNSKTIQHIVAENLKLAPAHHVHYHKLFSSTLHAN